ncbi:MAG: double-strand break repair protein AddB [Minwuia sp.]|nr:double-strand break repair protein AddB [Minwuia sp.]
MGRVATIPAGAPFVDCLAARLLERHGPDGDGQLPDTLVLLPTRRAVRGLTEAFLRVSEGRALLLPLMRPLGDLSEDDAPVNLLDPVDEEDLPAAISDTRRRLILSRLVAAGPISTAGPAGAMALADALARLLDETATERLDFADLRDLVPDDFQAHWEETLRFLTIITQAWPAVLSDLDLIDPAARRDMLMQRLAARLRDSGSAAPVIIAGSTGSVPGTADLMQAVLTLDQGRVVLPGFEADKDATEHKEILAEPAHPQHGMRHLLRLLHVNPADVDIWAGAAGDQPGVTRSAHRHALLTETMRPATTTDRWQDLSHLTPDALDGLSVVEAEHPGQEALAIALLLRREMEQPARTAALVTPDRSLGRRVAAELARFGITVDDTGGTPLRLTPPGRFLGLLAGALADGFTPVSLLALMKHPLTGLGLDTATLRRAVRTLERQAMRGVRLHVDLDGFIAVLADDVHAGPAPDWLLALADATRPLCRALTDGAMPLSALLQAFVEIAEVLAATDTISGAERLWQGEAGEQAAMLITDLLDVANDGAPVAAEDWPDLLDRLIGGATVRPRFGTHPRIRILGPLEARLQTADLMILGGLNEGTWPAEANVDPWMSRGMRAQFGLPAPERRIGLQAHDFSQLAASGTVVLTRSLKAEGTPTVPSRWLLRLRSVASGAGLSLDQDTGLIQLARAIDTPAEQTAIDPPSPRPPVAARPDKLSVTAVERLIRDPYDIYASRILRLRALDPLDEEPGPRQKGDLIHAAFDRFAKDRPGAWQSSDWPHLRRIGVEVFRELEARPAIHALWWHRFEKAAHWLLDQDVADPTDVTRRLAEVDGEHPGLAHLPGFHLTAQADRIDLMADGSARIVDYKTGSPPSQKQVAAGFAVQMPLQGLILGAGGFTDAGQPDLTDLVHIRVHGIREGGEWKPLKHPLGDLLADVEAGLVSLITEYMDPQTPYLSRPRVQFLGYPGDYDHLARVAEWSTTEGGEGEA